MWMIRVSGGPRNWHFLIKTHEIDTCDKCIGRIGPEAYRLGWPTRRFAKQYTSNCFLCRSERRKLSSVPSNERLDVARQHNHRHAACLHDRIVELSNVELR